MVSKEITLTEIAALTQATALYPHEARKLLHEHGVLPVKPDPLCKTCQYWKDSKWFSDGGWGTCVRLSTKHNGSLSALSTGDPALQSTIFTHEKFGCSECQRKDSEAQE